MPELVSDCPRCGAKKITFDAGQEHYIRQQYNWQRWYEIFCICRHCSQSTTFVIAQEDSNFSAILKTTDGFKKLSGALNNYFDVKSHISLRHHVIHRPPEFLPENIQETFTEGATCLSVECWNAAAAMFRQCLDLATKSMLPTEDTQGLNSKQRRDLGLRLQWLFDNDRLPSELRELARCIREDGNDGAHDGTLVKEDAHDLLDFTTAFLERIYTEPAKIKQAEERRQERRKQA